MRRLYSLLVFTFFALSFPLQAADCQNPTATLSLNGILDSQRIQYPFVEGLGGGEALYYKITLSSEGRLRLQTDRDRVHSDDTVNTYGQLLDENCQEIYEDTQVQETPRYFEIDRTLEAGTYFLKVYNKVKLDDSSSSLAKGYFQVESDFTASLPEKSIDFWRTSPTTISSGEEIVYTLHIKNSGSETTNGIRIEDPFPTPQYLNFVSPVDASEWSCQTESDRVVCDLTSGEIASGETVELKLKYRADYDTEDRTVQNTTRMTATYADGSEIQKNNTRTILIKKVYPSVDISIETTLPGSGTTISSIVQNDSFDYRIEVTNTGSIDDENLTLSDLVPDSYEVESVNYDSSVWDCGASSGQQINCRLLSPLEPSQKREIRIRAKAVGESGEQNDATTIADTIVGEVNDADSITLNIEPAYYVIAIQKSADRSTVVKGHSLRYRIEVTNGGNSELNGVRVTDIFPPELAPQEIEGDQEWDCSASDLGARKIDCTLNSPLNQNQKADFTVVAVAEKVAQNVENEAKVECDEAPDATSVATVEIVSPEPSIRLTKSAPSPVDPLESFYFSFRVENNGTESLNAVTLSDTVDSRWIIPDDWNDRVPTSWSCQRNDRSFECTCNETVLPGNEAQVLMLKMKAPYTESAITIANTAVTRGSSDAGNVENQDAASVNVRPVQIGLAFVKISDKSSVKHPETFNYTLTVFNEGNVAENNVTISDTLPEIFGDKFTVKKGAFDCTVGEGREINCRLDRLDPHMQASFEIEVEAPLVTANEVVTNYAETEGVVVIPDAPDKTVENNSSVDVTILPPDSDLRISKSSSSVKILDGEDFNYTITVKNEGLAAEYNLSVVDEIPSDLKILQISASGWSCNRSDQTVECRLSELDSAKQASDIVISVEAPSKIVADKSVRNSAIVTSSRETKGRQASATVALVSASSALEMNLLSDPVELFTKEAYRYRILLSNNSDDDIGTIHIQTRLPDEVDYRGYESDEFGCSISDRLVTCDLNTTFAPGQREIDLLVTAPETEQNLTCSAVLTSEINSDPTEKNATTVVKGRDTHLVFTKAETDKDPLKPNDVFHYILQVKNTADSDKTDINATDVTLRFIPDENLSYLSIVSGGWECSGDKNITCILPLLQPKEISPQIEIEYKAVTPGMAISVASVRAKESVTDENTTISTEIKEVVEADVKLSMSDDPDPVEGGNLYRYKIIVQNTHPSKAIEELKLELNTTSVDNFQLNGFVSHNDWNCAQVGDTVLCLMRHPLEADSKVALTLEAIAPVKETTIEVNATVSSPYLNDPNPSDNHVLEKTKIIKTDFSGDNVRDFTRVPIQGAEDANLFGDILSIGTHSICEKDEKGECKEPTYPINNYISQTYVKLDTRYGAKFINSTNAELKLKPNDDVIWAGLYWMGRIDKNQQGYRAKMEKAFRVYFRHESDTDYHEILSERNADAIDNNGMLIHGVDKFNFINGTTYFDYQGMADVTEYVRKYKSGRYWVADIQSSEGDNLSAGWNLVVIVRDTSSVPVRELRNITVFDGFQGVWKSSMDIDNKYPDEVNQTVRGFLTPAAGSIDSKFYFFAFEGDKTFKDYIRISDKFGTMHTLSNSLNPSDDVVNGTVSNNGVSVTDRNPSLNNSLGIDIDAFYLGDVNGTGSGIINNAQTSTEISIGSDGDRFFLGMFAFSTYLYEPVCYLQRYMTEDFASALPSEIHLGDTIGIEVEMRNKEVQDVKNFKTIVTIDPIFIEDNSSFEIRNLDTNGNLQPNYVSDPDLFHFEKVSKSDENLTEVTIHAGSGATKTKGGDLYGEMSVFFRYKVKVDAFNEDNRTLNLYEVSYEPSNKKIMVPPCSDQQILPPILKNHTTGFDVTHHGGLQDGLNDGYTNGDHTKPNNENHLFTQVQNRAFSIDVIGMDDGNFSLVRGTPFRGVVMVDLVDLNTTASCESFPIRMSDAVSFDDAIRAVASFEYPDSLRYGGFRVRYLVDKYGRYLQWDPNGSDLNRLREILKLSGYRDGRCQNSCEGVSATLKSCQECLYKNIDDGGLAKVSCATDSFSIKPEKISLDVNETPPLKGGALYRLDIDANATYYEPVILPPKGVLEYQLVAPSGCAAQATSGNLLNSSLVFTNGKAALPSFNYPNVGNITLTYKESFWTLIDQNSTDANMSDCVIGSGSNTPNAQGKVGCDVEGVENFEFVPDRFETDIHLAPRVGNFVYLSEDPKMSGELDLTLKAMLVNSAGPATNYTAGCFAKDVDLRLSILQEPQDWNGRGDVYTRIRFFGDGNRTVNTGSLQDGSFKVGADFFNSGIAANVPVYVNFRRERSKPQEPFTLHRNDFNLTVTDGNVSGADFDRISDQTVPYFYGRVHAVEYHTSKTDCSVPIYYEMYCKECNKSVYLTQTNHESADSVHWYIINNLHTSILQGSVKSAISRNHTEITDIRLGHISLSLGSLKPPHSDRIVMHPDSWLLFNPFSEHIVDPSFYIHFYSGGKKWGGRGELGHTLDVNISKQGNRKMEW